MNLDFKKIFISLAYISTPTHIYLDINKIELDELYELFEKIKEKIYKVNPTLDMKVKSYKVYEEEYGGFQYYGLLELNIDTLTQEEAIFINNLICANI